MKILLVGEYSNVHHTLAVALRTLGHDVTLATDGDGWKNYPRDIDLKRPEGKGLVSKLAYGLRLERVFARLDQYDVIQLINPIFLPLRAERIMRYYRRLRRHTQRLYVGAFGIDFYYAKAALDGHTFRYSDFLVGQTPHDFEDRATWMADWVEGPKGKVCRDIMADCDGIVAGLYEYHAAYATVYGEKLAFIPFPVAVQLDKGHIRGTSGGPIRFFIGIQRHRSLYKGTDIMWRALRRVAEAYPDACEVVRVENVPFAEYCRLMDRSDVILDQLYSYTPAMNALEAMAHGMVVVGGGEPENYAILGEEQLRPIINVQPNERSVYEALSRLVRHPEMIADLSRQSMAYVSRHHDAQKVARQYVDFWTRG